MLIDIVVFDYIPFPVSLYSTQWGCRKKRRKNWKSPYMFSI